MMNDNNFKWTRRSWLRRATLGAGAAALLPYADRLVAEARGATMMPKRVVFVVEGNGWWDWEPQASGGQITALSPSMAPLTPYLDRMTIASGLQLLDGGGHSHHYSGMTCVKNVGASKMPGAASIDQEIATVLGASFPWKSLQFAANKSRSLDQSCLASGRMRPVASIGNPQTALASTFGLAGGEGGSLVYRRRRLLESMREDSEQLGAHLAGPEQQKLEHVRYQVELMSNRIMYMQDNSDDVLQCKQGVDAIPAPGSFEMGSVEERSVGFFDVAAQSLICGLTPVVTIQASAGIRSFDMMYSGLGFTMGKHGLGHGGTDPVAGRQDTIHAFYATLIRGLCDRLAAAPEGDGTVLDNTIIVWLNENGTAHHSRPHYPYVGMVIGGQNTGLNLGGRYHDFEMNRSWADFFNTIGHAVGVPLDEFGKDGTAPIQGPLEPLLA